LSLIIYIPFDALSNDAWVEAVGWIGLIGIALVAVSKEKNETADIERLRFKSFFQGFFGMLLVVVTFSLSNLIVTDDKITIAKAVGYLRANDVLKFSYIFLITYLLSFRYKMKQRIQHNSV
jgi:hypothetical protein